MKKFDIAPGGFKKVKKQILLRIIPIMALAIVGGIAITAYNLKDDDVNIWPFFIPIVCLSVGFGLYRGLRRQKASFESYQLIVDDEMLTRHQFNTQTIIMRYEDIITIEKISNGDFVVKANNYNSKLIIPAQVENYAELELLLNSIKTITPKPASSLLKYASLGATLMMVILMVCVYVSDNKIIVGTSGVFVAALMIYGFYEVQTNKNIDLKTKRSSWFIIIVLISMIAIVYHKLIL
jgi:hypothetical protein